MKKTLRILFMCFSIVLISIGYLVAVKQESNLAFSQKVDIGGFKLHIQIMGEGTPAVIINPGLGSTAKSWTSIQKQVAEFTLCASYDRAGIGESEPSPLPRENIHVAQELHMLLKNADIHPPYILVGHSFGSIHILAYADLFPDEIGGLVFVDPKDGTTFDGWNDDLKPEKFEQLFTLFENFYASRPGIVKAEWEVLKKSIGNPQKFDKLPNAPVVLLSSTRLSENETNFGLTPAVVNSSLRVHKELLKKFSDSTHIITDESGHSIQDDEPELVVDAIRKIVDQIRNNIK